MVFGYISLVHINELTNPDVLEANDANAERDVMLILEVRSERTIGHAHRELTQSLCWPPHGIVARMTKHTNKKSRRNLLPLQLDATPFGVQSLSGIKQLNDSALLDQ